jgi:hypothetical protein
VSDPALLLQRLEAIGASLAQSEGALALIGLGSVGVQRERLDVYSDLDFFAIVRAGYKARFIDKLDWMACLGDIDYCLRNTVDGYKLLYADGVFCEFAVFEPQELSGIPFSPGVLVWKAEGVPDSIAAPVQARLPEPGRDEEWLVGEALTCLYVGLNRLARGETLSAQRFIQHFAVDRVLELIALREPTRVTSADAFAIERRFEQRHPESRALLAQAVQGYGRSAESALALLEYLKRNHAINDAIERRIRQLAG